MKSYFLAPVPTDARATTALSEALPGRTGIWLLKGTDGDVIAYFSLVECDDTTGFPTITADISGRHYYQDDEVLAVLRELQTQLGGEIINDA